MLPAPEQILTVAQMQAAERALIDAGSSVEALMRIAGRGAGEWIWRMSGGRPVTVLCGPGNNGGDGFVVARLLRRLRANVTVVMLASPAELSRDAAAMYRRWLRVGGTSSTKRFQSFEQGQALFTKSDLGIDE